MEYKYVEDLPGGDIWSVELILYSRVFPEYNEGIFEEYLFDDEDEAREKFNEICTADVAWSELLFHENNYYDTISVFLCLNFYENGTCQDDFENTIAEEELLTRR